MAEKEVKVEQPQSTEEMVPKSVYDDLLRQATELSNRYMRLTELYNILVEKYLNTERK